MEEIGDTNQTTPPQPITVGVITHRGRFNSLVNFLELLATPLQAYEQWFHRIVIQSQLYRHTNRLFSWSRSSFPASATLIMY